MKTIHLLLLICCIIFLSPKNEKVFFHEKENEEPNDWFINQRIFPSGKIDYDAYQQALQLKNEMLAAHVDRDNLQWEFKGPLNVGGRVQDVEMDPNNQQIIYAGSASGGVFKSTDAGANWTAIFDAQPSLSIGDVALAPSNSNIIYVGTGEPNCGGGSVTYDGAGVFKSMDAGTTWTHVGLDSTRNTGRIVVDPQNSNRVFVATMGDLFGKGIHRGVYRTLDGGASWQQVLHVNDSTGAIDLAINPLHPDTIYACAWERIRTFTYENYGGNWCGIYRSVNGGDTWTLLTSGLPSGNNQGRIGIDISQSNPNVLYAIYADQTGYFLGLYKTTNAGNTWSQVNDNSLSGMFASYGWWFGRVKVDPTDEDIVFAIGFDVYKSSNGGNSWNYSSSGEHVDHHAMFIHPQNHNLVLDANDGGLYLSSNGGNNYSHFDNLPITQFYTTEIDNSNPTNLYGGAQDNNVIRTLTGNLNDWSSIIGGDGFYVLVDPINPNHQYGESQYGNFLASNNGGGSFNGATSGISNSERKNWNTPVVFNPQNPKSLYYGAQRLYKTVNRANSWNAISLDLTNGFTSGNITYGTITTISVSPIDTNIIYAGTDDGNVWMSSDNGGNWLNVAVSLPNRWVTRVTTDLYNAQTAYVTLSGYKYHDNLTHIYETNDGGNSWQSIAGNLPDVPASDLVVDPFDSSTLYVATDVGVFVTHDDGSVWDILGNGLPNVPVLDMIYYATEQKLIVATYGRGMYSIAIDYNLSSQQISSSSFNIDIVPNPVHDVLNIFFRNNFSNPSISVYDVKGRMVYEKKNLLLANHASGVPVGFLSSGIYTLSVEEGEKKCVKKFVIE